MNIPGGPNKSIDRVCSLNKLINRKYFAYFKFFRCLGKKSLDSKNFEFIGIEREYDKKLQIMSWFRLITRSKPFIWTTQ
jgi:hypothetical protein